MSHARYSYISVVVVGMGVWHLYSLHTDTVEALEEVAVVALHSFDTTKFKITVASCYAKGYKPIFDLKLSLQLTLVKMFLG